MREVVDDAERAHRVRGGLGHRDHHAACRIVESEAHGIREPLYRLDRHRGRYARLGQGLGIKGAGVCVGNTALRGPAGCAVFAAEHVADVLSATGRSHAGLCAAGESPDTLLRVVQRHALGRVGILQGRLGPLRLGAAGPLRPGGRYHP